jgi:hypothetical protein
LRVTNVGLCVPLACHQSVDSSLNLVIHPSTASHQPQSDRPHAQFAHARDPTRSPPQGQMDSHHNLKAPMLCCTLHHARYRSSVPSASASTGSCLAVADVLRPLDGAEAQFTCGGTCLLLRALLCGQAAAHPPASENPNPCLRQGCSHLSVPGSLRFFFHNKNRFQKVSVDLKSVTKKLFQNVALG